MATSLWRLCVTSEFSAAHALRNYNGKCENLHGHNFSVAITVEGSTLTPDTELLIDFSDIKHMLKDVLSKLDHQVLNQSPPFNSINPSSENLSRHIFQLFVPMLKNYPVRLYSVTVGEKEGQSATYFEQ